MSFEINYIPDTSQSSGYRAVLGGKYSEFSEFYYIYSRRGIWLQDVYID